jgi:hypothetical protein
MTNHSRFPAPPGEHEIPVHTRNYDVRTYRIDASTMRIRGRLTDTKPAGLYVDGDSETLDVHDMVVDLVVGYPELTIREVTVVMDTHPHTSCPSIEPAYQHLLGASIARGFTRRLTELFGGPSGCTHVGALLKAMAPVAVQSMYSMQLADPNKPKRWNGDEHDPEERVRAQAFVRNSCHVWVDEGRMMTASDRGEPLEAPLWIRHRLEKLGRSSELAKWK